MVGFAYGPNGISSGSGDFSIPSHDGNTARNMRLMKFRYFDKNGHGTSTSTYNFHVINDFGLSTQGGMIIYHCHNWVNDRSLGIISWYNNGTGAPLHVVALDKIFETGHVASVTKGSSDHEIVLNFTGTHTNSHGHMLHMWGGR